MKWLPTRTADECIALATRQNRGEDLGLSDTFLRQWRSVDAVPAPIALVPPVQAAPKAKPVVEAPKAVETPKASESKVTELPVAELAPAPVPAKAATAPAANEAVA